MMKGLVLFYDQVDFTSIMLLIIGLKEKILILRVRIVLVVYLVSLILPKNYDRLLSKLTGPSHKTETALKNANLQHSKHSDERHIHLIPSKSVLTNRTNDPRK